VDHKDFFMYHGVAVPAGCEFMVEQLYQAFKARMIEELCTETVKNEYGQHSFLRLIDTTKDTE
jgi:hypothetical protein